MARTVRDANLDSRTARSRLKARGKPHYRTLDPGLHLGYRKPRGGAGKWVVRHYKGGQEYTVETIATADDVSDRTVSTCLSFAQAQSKARERRDASSRTAAGVSGPLTVAEAMADYLAFLDSNRKSAEVSRYSYRAFIEKPLGSIEVAALTTKKIRDWHADIAKAAPRLRTRKGDDQQHRKIKSNDETKRQRKASANRILTVLKAGLNRAWRDGRVQSDAAWRRVEPFENVDAARIRYLTVAESKRLLNASETQFRKLVQAALETGARYGELTRLTAATSTPESGTLAVRVSKTGKPRHVVLTDEGRAFFKQACIGRASGQLIFTKKANGGPWGKSHQRDPMRAACEAAKIEPPASFHTLRHTWASLAVMAGVPLLVVAKNLGHNDTRMVEKHYGHLAPSYIADAIRAGAPKFGFKPDRKVTSLERRA